MAARSRANLINLLRDIFPNKEEHIVMEIVDSFLNLEDDIDITLDEINLLLNIVKVTEDENVGVDVSVPTARMHLPAGTATAGTAPIKLTSGINLTTPENGVFEFDGTNLYFTSGGTRKTITMT